MTPDSYFVLTLALKMALAAGFVIAATVTAERAGPAIGALIATLPVSAGPAYVFLALDHDAAFIGQAALGSLISNAATSLYALTFILIAQRGGLVRSIVCGISVWLAVALGLRMFDWNAGWATLINIAIVSLCWRIALPFRNVAMPRLPLRWYDFAIRGAMVALLVASVVTLSFHIGPGGSGMLAVFPIVFTSIMAILYRRVGGRATAAVLAHSFTGLAGFGAACLTLHLSAVPFGSAIALSLALAVSIGWNVAIYAIRRRKTRAANPAAMAGAE